MNTTTAYRNFAAQRDLSLMMVLAWDTDALTEPQVGEIRGDDNDNVIPFPVASNGRDRAQANGVRLEPDREQLTWFVQALFKHATLGNWVSLRSFRDKGEKNQKPFNVTPHQLNGNFDILIDKAYCDAEVAANESEKIVFCPPIATFKIRYKAREVDLAEGLALSVECDTDAQEARAKLEALLGPATIVVESGGEWIDPATGEVKPTAACALSLEGTGTRRGHAREAEAGAHTRDGDCRR